MPELPEAETIARELHEHIAGRTFGTCHLERSDVVRGHPAPLCCLVNGSRVIRVWRRAKRVVVELKSDKFSPNSFDLIFHLGMSGRLLVMNSDEEIEPHTHLRITIDGTDRELRFRDPRRFGGIWVEAGGEEHIGKRLGALGAEPLEIGLRDFRKLLDRKRQIKALLLDQQTIAGLGNIYCDEALHASGIHPTALSGDIEPDDASKLLRSIKSILKSAIKAKGTTLLDYRTVDGMTGSFKKRHRVYGRTGEPCKTCQSPIEHLQVAGRSTFVCPSCQAPR